MPHGESYRFCAIILLQLLRQGLVPHALVYDIACRFGPWFRGLLKTLQRRLQEQPDDPAVLGLDADVLAEATRMATVVGDFHRNMHVASCQATNVVTDGSKRAAGEATEQLWAQFSGGALRRLKYMRLENFVLILECLFQYLNGRSDARLGSWLRKRVKDLAAELERVRVDLAHLGAGALVRVRAPARIVCVCVCVCVPVSRVVSRVCCAQAVARKGCLRAQEVSPSDPTQPCRDDLGVPDRGEMTSELQLVLVKCKLHALGPDEPLPRDLALPQAGKRRRGDGVKQLKADVDRLDKIVDDGSDAKLKNVMAPEFLACVRRLCDVQVRAGLLLCRRRLRTHDL